MPVPRTFTLHGKEPRALFSDCLTRKWTHLESLIGVVQFDEIVLLACGPSLPRNPIWQQRAPHLPVLGVNRAFLGHELDWWIITSDMLVVTPQELIKVLGALGEKTKILAANYAVETRASGALRASMMRANSNTFNRMPNPLYLYDVIGNKRTRALGSDYEKQAFRHGCVYGHRSVVTGAIEICRLLGARKVHLFGHDAQPKGRQYYFNEKLKPDVWMRTQTKLVFRRMLGSLEWAHKNLWRGKIEVINYCPTSANRVFKRCDPKAFPA